jgi:hypothetical protein
MDSYKKLSEELLKKDGIDPANIPDSERTMFRQLLDKHLRTKRPESVIRRIVMLTKLKYKVAALLGCVILVSAAAAITVPGIHNAIRNFVSAFNEKDIDTLVELTDPMYAVHQQVQDLKNVLTEESKLKIVSLYTDDNYALAITTDVKIINDGPNRNREEQKGPLVITLNRKNDIWLVIDIDIENEQTVKNELKRFLEEHPNATELKIK